VEKFFKYPWVIVGVTALITIVFALQLPRVRMDNNISGFLPDDNPARVISKHLEAEYGDEIMISLGLERPYGTVFDGAFLARIREFTQAVEDIELVKDTNSIMSTQYITSDSESIIVTDLVDEDFSGTPEEIAELKRRIASWDMYQGSLVSDDLSSTQIVVRINASNDEAGSPEVTAVLIQVRDMAKDMFSGYASVYTAGQPLVSATLTESAITDVVVLVPFVILILIAVLVISFRRLSYVELPLLTVIIATILTIGAMPLLGVTLTILCVILPTILIAVGSAYGIHVVSHYKDELHGKTFTIEEHRSFVFGITRKLLKPVFLAALTTFAGFVSIAFSPLKPMRDFGLFSGFGVIAAFVVAITLIPAILLIRGPKAAKRAAQNAKKAGIRKPDFDFQTELTGTLNTIAKKKALVLVITALVVVVSLIGASKVVVNNSLVEFFNENAEVSRSDRFIRERFGGSTQLILSVEADDTQTLLNPETLSALDGLAAHLIQRVPYVTKVTGFTNTIKRMNQLFNVDESPGGMVPNSQAAYSSETGGFGFGDFGFEDDEGEEINFVDFAQSANSETKPEGERPASSETSITFAMLNAAAGKQANMSANDLVRELERMTNYEGYSYYEIPADPVRYGKETGEELQQLVSNYLVLLAGQTDDSMSNDPLEPTAIETMILINSQWQKDSQNVIQAVNDYVEANFPKNVKVLIGGGATQENAIVDLVTNAQVISMVSSILIVLLIVAFSYKSLAAGLIAALPLAITILGNFAVMGFLGITINIATALTASLAVGIGIDYMIHFMDAFKREYQNGGDYLYRTFAGAGKAILINAVSVGAGFGVLAFSQFRVMAQFGGLTALSMAISVIVSLTVVPVLLTTVKPKFIYKKNSVSR
jgi:predicted RND superfamily exporter protein